MEQKNKYKIMLESGLNEPTAKKLVQKNMINSFAQAVKDTSTKTNKEKKQRRRKRRGKQKNNN